MRSRHSTKMVLLALTLVGGTAARARAETATDLPPVYQARDVIEEGPARLLGDDAGLTIDHGLLTGRLERGDYRVKITPDAATGSGPMGKVDVRIKRLAQGFEVAGLWNGGHLRFVVGPDEIRGTAMKQISDEDRGYQSCRYDLERPARQSAYAGTAECLGQKPLRLEVQPRTASDLSVEENVVLLVAYFAAPPAVWNP